MSVSVLASPSRAFVPLRLRHRSWMVRTGAVLAATGALAACSLISVPMVPVPITLQTFGVTVVAALFGRKLGAAAILAWLAEGALGLPVLSAGHSGLAYMMGPTGGYLAAFVVVGLLVGWAADLGMTARNAILSCILMAAANLAILGLGALWLAGFVGAAKAVVLGVTPFVIGGLIKGALAGTCIEAARRHLPLR